MTLRSALRARRDVREFERLPQRARTVVFYGEDPGAWDHMGGLVEGLAVTFNRPVCYLAADPEDPILRRRPPGVSVYFVGNGKHRRQLFENLEANLLICTRMSGESRSLIGVSPHAIHRIYVLHSLFSCHMYYPPDYFAPYDSVLCAGPHQLVELEALCEMQGRKALSLIPVGSAKIDSMLARRRAKPDSGSSLGRHILIAPGRPETGLLSIGREIVELLLRADFKLTLRPHPQSSSEDRKALKTLDRTFADHPCFWVDDDTTGISGLLHADALVTDWSSVSFDFAFGAERPVLFVDFPRPIQNPQFGSLQRHPVETALRESLGSVLPPSQLRDMPTRLLDLCRELPDRVETLRSLRSQHLFNIGTSASLGATAIEAIATGINPQDSLRHAIRSIRNDKSSPLRRA